MFTLNYVINFVKFTFCILALIVMIEALYKLLKY